MLAFTPRLEGDLGVRNVRLASNVLVDGVGEASSVDVAKAWGNVTCVNTTFVFGGTRTTVASGCAAAASVVDADDHQERSHVRETVL